MKCPECYRNHPYRNGMTCDCGYQFVLNPKSDEFTDGKLITAMRRASGNGTRYFTVNQLITELYKNKSYGLLISGVVCILVSILIFATGVKFIILAGLVGLTGGYLLVEYFTPGRRQRANGSRLIEKYERAKGISKWRLQDDQPLADPPPEWKETDIYDYGVEGILFVDRDILVDLLVLNQWHLTNRILVVCQSGYPSYLVSHVNRLLQERPDLPIFAVHDCHADNDHFMRQLKASALFPLHDKHIQDVSLSSDDLNRTPNLKRFADRGSVAIDHLRWGRLSFGLTQAIDSGVLLIDVIGQNYDGGDSEISFG